MRHEGDNSTRSLDGERVALTWDGSRTRAKFIVDPVTFGVQVSQFEGDIRFENELRGERAPQVGSSQGGLTFSIEQSFITTLSCNGQSQCAGASRGQLCGGRGQGAGGLARGGDDDASLRGEFVPEEGGEPLVLRGGQAPSGCRIGWSAINSWRSPSGIASCSKRGQDASDGDRRDAWHIQRHDHAIISR